jgi:alpha-tubulin suppressor-like RCC1 family protein
MFSIKFNIFNFLNFKTIKRGLIGHNGKESQLTPKKVEALTDDVIVDVACGDYQTCVVTSTGSIFTWRDGLAIGHGASCIFLSPSLLQDLSSKGVVSVSASAYHNASSTVCVTKSGEVFTWGHGRYGKLGHGDEINQESPKRVEALVGVKAKTVSSGGQHTAVCTEDGHVYTCGYGGYGQLGHGDRDKKTSPALVQALEGKNITQVQCGFYHTMALTSSGYVLSWGRGIQGELGHGNVKQKCLTMPCLIEALREHNVVQITSKNCSHCAVLVDPTIPSIIRQSQQAFVNNKLHSDVVFMVENEPLYANVNVLSQKSDYFAAMFRSNMRESIERVVQVSDCSKASFLHVLEYLCLDGFTVCLDDVVELWGLADMYQMEGLKYCCMGALQRGLSEDSVSEVLEEVEELSCPCDELKRMCHEYLACLARSRALKDKEKYLSVLRNDWSSHKIQC